MQAQSIPHVFAPIINQPVNAPLRRSKTKSNAPTLEYMESFKNSDGKYQCNYCDRSYLHFKHLKRHFMKHTGNRPHVCNICQDTFCRSDILKRHYVRCLNKFKHTGKCSSISRVPKRILPNQIYTPPTLSYNSFPSQPQLYQQCFPASFPYYQQALPPNTSAFSCYQGSEVSNFKPAFVNTPMDSPTSDCNMFSEPVPCSLGNPISSPHEHNLAQSFSAYQTGSATTPALPQSVLTPSLKCDPNLPTEINDTAFGSAPFKGQGLAIFQADGMSFSTSDGQEISSQCNPSMALPQDFSALSTLTPPDSATSPGESFTAQYNAFYQNDKDLTTLAQINSKPQPLLSPPDHQLSQFDSNSIPNSYIKNCPNYVVQQQGFSNTSVPSPPTTVSSPDTGNTKEHIELTTTGFPGCFFDYNLGPNFSVSTPLPLTIPSPHQPTAEYVFQQVAK